MIKDLLQTVFGYGKELTWWQVTDRSFAMFIIALVLIRVGGMRIFSRKTAFDDIVTVMLGAVLSRGITGAVPFFSAVAGGATLVLVHRVLAWCCIKNGQFEKLVKGRPVILFEKGRIHFSNMRMCSLTGSDLMESLRLETNRETLDDVTVAYMENNGSISFILKEENK